MENCFIISNYDQLKALSDPFRIKIVNHLIEGAYTGQQISQSLEIPRAKIHYHLNELEKNGLIEVVRTEVKNGIIQKFYRSVAYSFMPAADLLPYTTEVGDYYRQTMLEVLNRSRLRVISAPEEAFHTPNANREEWPRIALRAEVQVTEKQFAAWLVRFKSLVEELADMKDPEGKWFYLSTVGLQVDEPLFDDEVDCGCETVSTAQESDTNAEREK